MSSSTPVLCLSLFLALCSTACHSEQMPLNDCSSGKDVQYICGLDDPEDLYHIPATPWVIAGSMGDETWQGGGLDLINTDSMEVRKIKPGFPNPDNSSVGEKTCPGPPEENLFSVHGISMRPIDDSTYQLLVVNHGGRESIEIFNVDLSADLPTFTWSGCMLLPNNASGNAVAVLPKGGFVVSSIVDISDSEAAEKLIAGKATGVIYEWTSSQGWKVIPNSSVSGNNGVAVSPDGKWLYIAGWADGSLTRLLLNRPNAEPDTIYFDFLPDNLKWTPQGSLLVAGQDASVKDVLDCVNGSEVVCAVDSTVAEVQPETLSYKTLIRLKGTPQFGGATSAIQIGDEFWVGTFRGNRIAKFKHPTHTSGNSARLWGRLDKTVELKDISIPVSWIYLLDARDDIPLDAFYAYWRDVHGLLAARGINQPNGIYRQHHLGLPDKSFWPKMDDVTVDVSGRNKIEGISWGSFDYDKTIRESSGHSRFINSLVKADEKNLFKGTYVHYSIGSNAVTLKDTAINDDIFQGEKEDFEIIVLIRKRDHISEASLREYILNVASTISSDERTLRASAYFLEPYNSSHWDTAGVENDLPLNEQYQVFLKLSFKNRDMGSSVLETEPVFKLIAKQSEFTTGIVVYPVRATYTLAYNGRPTYVGLRGYPAMKLVEKFRAKNQVQLDTLQALYGRQVKEPTH